MNAPLDRLANQLRDELRASAGDRPAVETLHRRSAWRTARRTAAGGAVVVAALVLVPQMGPSGDGLSIDPVAPSAEPGPSPSSSTAAAPNEGSEPPPTQPQSGPDVRVLDVPNPVPSRVLAVRPSGSPSLAVIDLERGEARIYRDGGAVTSGDAIDGATLLLNGTVVVWQNGTVRAFTDGLDRPPLEYKPDELINPTGVAPAFRVVPSFDGSALWVVQIGMGCCGESIPGRADLVDLETGGVRLVAELPSNSFPVAATPHGLVLYTLRYTETDDGWVAEPGSHEVLLLDDGGEVTSVAEGEALAASAEDVAVLTCDDHDRYRGCELVLVDVATGTRRNVEPPEAGTWTRATAPGIPTSTPPWNATAPDGRILAGLASPTGSHLVAIDPSDATTSVLLEFDGSLPRAAWDRAGRSVVTSTGRDLTVHDLEADTSFTVRDAIPDEHYILGMN